MRYLNKTSAVGENNANNSFSSINVVANENGSVFERLESIAVNIGTSTISDLISTDKIKVITTTIDLHQVAGDYDLFTGTNGDVIVESLTYRNANVDVSDDSDITSISIQTDDATPLTIFSSDNGAIANLTAEAQISWSGSAIIKPETKIQLTIAGGTSDETCVSDVVVKYRPVNSGTGTLTI